MAFFTNTYTALTTGEPKEELDKWRDDAASCKAFGIYATAAVEQYLTTVARPQHHEMHDQNQAYVSQWVEAFEDDNKVMGVRAHVNLPAYQVIGLYPGSVDLLEDTPQYHAHLPGRFFIRWQCPTGRIATFTAGDALLQHLNTGRDYTMLSNVWLVPCILNGLRRLVLITVRVINRGTELFCGAETFSLGAHLIVKRTPKVISGELARYQLEPTPNVAHLVHAVTAADDDVPYAEVDEDEDEEDSSTEEQQSGPVERQQQPPLPQPQRGHKRSGTVASAGDEVEDDYTEGNGVLASVRARRRAAKRRKLREQKPDEEQPKRPRGRPPKLAPKPAEREGPALLRFVVEPKPTPPPPPQPPIVARELLAPQPTQPVTPNTPPRQWRVVAASTPPSQPSQPVPRIVTPPTPPQSSLVELQSTPLIAPVGPWQQQQQPQPQPQRRWHFTLGPRPLPPTPIPTPPPTEEAAAAASTVVATPVPAHFIMDEALRLALMKQHCNPSQINVILVQYGIGTIGQIGLLRNQHPTSWNALPIVLRGILEQVYHESQ